MRLLVTGATGYIGGAVIAALRDAGHDVALFLHRASLSDPVGVEEHHGELLDLNAVAAAVRGVDAVIHLAALTSVRESIEHPARFYRVNVGGTATVLEALEVEAAVEGRTPLFLLASTGGVYGTPARQPISEETPHNPLSPYAVTKSVAERVVMSAAATGSVRAAALRIFNAAGAAKGLGDEHGTRIITRAAAAAAGRVTHVDVFGDGTAVRDFVHVNDIGSAFVAVLNNLADEASAENYGVFNVGATPATVSEVIEAAGRLSDTEIAKRHRPASPSEARELRADTTRLRGLGWRPKRSDMDQLVRDEFAEFA